MKRSRNPEENKLTVLTCDPSIRAWGWAVVYGNDVILDCGCIKTESENKKRHIYKADDIARRIAIIVHELNKVIREECVQYLITESPHGSKDANSAVMIGICAGIIETLSICNNLSIEHYFEGESKIAATGKKDASKPEMVKAMKKKFGNGWCTGIKYKDEAIADSLAIYNLACQESPTLKLINKGHLS